MSPSPQSYHRVYQRNRYNTDIQYRMQRYLRTKIRAALRNNSKRGSAIELLGCSIEFFRAHITRQFSGSMSWENYKDVWELDHKKALASFDLTNPRHVKEACNWRNFQPLPPQQNKRKSSKPVTQA